MVFRISVFEISQVQLSVPYLLKHFNISLMILIVPSFGHTEVLDSLRTDCVSSVELSERFGQYVSNILGLSCGGSL